MKRIVSLVLLMSMSLNSFAGVIGVQKLERELNEYQFAMTVEWDQKDQKFYDAKTQEFFSGMEKIIREEGLSNQEVLSLVEKKFVSHKAIEALKLKLNLLSKSESPEELAKALQESSKEMYAQGASWNGEIMWPVALGIVIIASIAYKWWWEKNHICSQWEERYDCSWKTWSDRHCSTETDSSGRQYEVCEHYYQKEEIETCGMMNFCLEYKEIQK